MVKFLVVGCGLSGCTIAQELSKNRDNDILVIDKRDHIAGNCYDYIDHGIRVSKYGAHIFHTNDEEVWNYVNQFAEWIPYEHRVKGNIKGTLFPIPVNLDTVNILLKKNLKNERDMKEWLFSNKERPDVIANGEQMALSKVGEQLYELIFKNYTYKQWAKYPHELDAEVLARIPVRTNHDDRYFTDKYQGLPKDGYTKLCQNMLNKSNISVQLNTCFYDTFIHKSHEFDHIYVTGRIDDFFKDSNLPKLEYRTINFEKHYLADVEKYQSLPVINYPSKDVDYTRIVEYKNFPYVCNQDKPGTIIVSETTTDEGEPYYPVPCKRNKLIYEEYKRLAETCSEKISFIGRLANYKYFNMDQAIRNALDNVQS